MRGKFITLEGMDGAGKSTHLPEVIAALQASGKEVVCTREPGGTPLGERLREILLHAPMHAETEALLMFAARREHIATVIEPALERGAYVVSDRFTDASFAYQGGAKSVDMEKLEIMEAWVHPDLQPDMTLLFDVPVAVSMERLSHARDPDKFEQEGPAFFEKIRNAYLDRARKAPERFHIINSDQPKEAVKQQLLKIIASI
jgi:dTMP kinase